MKFCPECGAALKYGNKFCTSCGSPIREETKTPHVESENIKSEGGTNWALLIIGIIAVGAVVITLMGLIVNSVDNTTPAVTNQAQYNQ